MPSPAPFTPDAFQLEALRAIRRWDCLVSVPTGAGKTWIALQAITRVLKTGGRGWYACPLKALSNAKFAEFGEAFGRESVGILTGDRKENPDAALIVGTTEILRNQLYDAMHQGRTLNTDFVVLDEAHFLGDTDRGVVWEEIMIYLPHRIPLLLLSATIRNSGQVAGWLESIRRKKCKIVTDPHRPVPLYPLVLHPGGTLLPLLDTSPDNKKGRLDPKIRSLLRIKKHPRWHFGKTLPPFGDILRVLRKYRLLPAIFFLKSRADCDNALELCRENRVADEARREALSRRLEALSQKSSHIAKHRQRQHLEHLAVGAHHSGQLPMWKMVVEQLMTEGLLDAVFATTTVAAGVNFPARTVVFLNSDRFNGREFLPLDATEFHQMTGRAGRRGMDKIGFAVAIPGKFMDLSHIARLMVSPPSEVHSQIRINFSMVLNLLLSHEPEQIQVLLRDSFAAYQMEVNPRNRRRPAAEISDPAHLLWQDFVRHWEFLISHGYVSDGGRLSDVGHWASRLRVDQPLMIAEGFRCGLLPDSDPALLVALLAAFVNEREVDDSGADKITSPRLKAAFKRLRKGLEPFARQMTASGFEVRPLYLRPAFSLYAWARGVPWENVRISSQMEPGDLVMLILRTADHLRHVSALAPEFPAAARSAEQALELILRDPVTENDQ